MSTAAIKLSPGRATLELSRFSMQGQQAMPRLVSAHGASTVQRLRTSRMKDDPAKSELTELFARVAEGDSDAFALVYDLTSEMVYGLVLRVIKAPAMAEEVTQEVYLQIWEQARSFDSAKGSVRGWVATLAHRRAVDAVRRSQSSRDREDRVPAEMPEEDVAESAVEADERDRVRRALSDLTELQLEAIELAYYGGLTYREVADHLGAPLGTVKSRMRDGLMRLREILGDGNV